MTTRKVIIGIVALVAVSAAIFAFVTRSGGPKSAALTARQEGMQLLGERLAKLLPGCKVLVLSNPFTKGAGYLDEKNQFERAGIKGLRKGLGGDSVVEVVFPEIKPEFLADRASVAIPSDSRTPLSFLITPSSVEQLANAHPECNVIVSLIGLPVGIDGFKMWDSKDQRAFALLLPDLRVLGSPAKAAEAFQRGKILAAVGDEAASGQPLIVTRENVVEVLKRQPRALGF